MHIPVEIKDLCLTLRDGLIAALGDKLYGLYVYGAAAFPDGAPTGDVDFNVILMEQLRKREHAAILELHRRLAVEYPPLGVGLDGYYLLLAEARCREYPTHQLRPEMFDNSWALHRAHILAGRCIVLHGPDPKTIFPPASWLELERDLYGELKYVQDHLADYPDYCILNLCRILYSFEYQNVVISKFAAAGWAHERYPRWQRHIELAKRSYAGLAGPDERQFMLAEVDKLFDFVSVLVSPE
ncbi:aminoglycoside adenylyltransferase domain-containing protein [Chloroflexota bacterium]